MQRSALTRIAQRGGIQLAALRRQMISLVMRSVPAIALVAITTWLIVTSTHASPDAERELVKMNAQYDEAIMRGDAAALGRIFADDFIYTSPKCEVLGKKEQIANLTARDFKLEDAKSDDVRIRVYGETAVMTGRFTAKLESAGKTDMIDERYTAVWVRRDGRWQLVAEQGNLKK